MLTMIGLLGAYSQEGVDGISLSDDGLRRLLMMHGSEGIRLLDAVLLVVRVYAHSWTHGDRSGKGLCRTVVEVEGGRGRDDVRREEIEFTGKKKQ